MTLGSPEWGYGGDFQYQTRCVACGVLFVHKSAAIILCDKCSRRRRDK